MLRWRYFLPFLVILGGLSTALLTANWWVKWALISGGESAVEAKVDIDQVRITYLPLSISIEGIQVTNPKFPMRNIVELGRVYVALNPRALLEKKIIIEGIKLEDISVNTSRKTSGELKGIKHKPQSKLSKELEAALDSQLAQVTSAIPQLKLPKLEELEVNKAYEKSKHALEVNQKKWEDTLKGNPFESEFSGLNKDIQTLQATTIKFNSIQDIAKIQATLMTIQSTMDRVKKIQTKFDQQKADLEREFESLLKSVLAIPEAGKQDYKNVMAPFSADRFKHIKFGTAVFMKPIQAELLPYLTKLQKLMYYKQKFSSPNPPRLRGRDPGQTILFETSHHFPKFWLKLLHISGNGKQGERISGQIQDVASDQRLIGKPILARIRAENLLKQQVRFSADFAQDRSSPSTVNHLKFSLDGLSISPYFKPKKQGDFYLKSGQLGLTSDVVVIGKSITSLTQVSVNGLGIVGPSASNPYDLNTIISDVLTRITLLQMTMRLTGPFKHLQVDFDSNVDDAFAAALSASVQKRLSSEQAKIQAQLDEIVSSKKAQVEQELAKQKAIADAWIKTQQTQLESYQKQLDQQRVQLETQLEKFKKDAENRVNQELDKAKVQAQKHLQNQAEQALKNPFKIFSR